MGNNFKLISNRSNFIINIDNLIVNLAPNNFTVISNETYVSLMSTSEYFRNLLDKSYIYCTDYDNKITILSKETNTINNTTTNNDTISDNSVLGAELKNFTPAKKPTKRGRGKANKK